MCFSEDGFCILYEVTLHYVKMSYILQDIQSVWSQHLATNNTLTDFQKFPGGRKFILQKLLLFHTDLRTSFRLLSTILSISLSSPSMGDCHLVPFYIILPGLLSNKDLLGPFIFLAAGFLILFLKVSMKHVWLPHL